MIELAFVPDVLQRTVQTMTEYDPEWKLPDRFFVDGTDVEALLTKKFTPTS